MKKTVSGLMIFVLLCALYAVPGQAEPWRPYESGEYRTWQSTVDGMRFDGYPTVYAIDLNSKIRDISTCTKAPVSVYYIAYDGELVLHTTMLFSIYEPGVLIPRETVATPDKGEQDKGICLFDAETFVLRSDSGMLFDDTDEISFTVRDYFRGLISPDCDLTIPLLREPMLEFSLSDTESINALDVDFCYLSGPAFPALFDGFDPAKTLTIDVCLGDEIVKSVTAVPTAFDPRGAYMTVRLQGEDSVNLHNLVCYEKIAGGNATASRYLYTYRLHVPEGLLLCGTVKNEASTINDVCCVSLSTRDVPIDLPAWFSAARKMVQNARLPLLRVALEKALSFMLTITHPDGARAIRQSYQDIGGKAPHTAADLIRTLLF